jgi:hypothetical protein
VNLGKTSCAPRRLSTAVEFAGSHIRYIDRKPSSMGIAGLKPRQLKPTVGTTEFGSTGSPAPSSPSPPARSHLVNLSYTALHHRQLRMAAGFFCVDPGSGWGSSLVHCTSVNSRVGFRFYLLRITRQIESQGSRSIAPRSSKIKQKTKSQQ